MCLCLAIPSCLLLVLAYGFLISDLGFSFLDRNSKFFDRILIFLEIKNRVWVLLKHYSCLVVSCFLFRFLFLLCIWISVSNLVRPQCKKKGLPEAFPIETLHSAGPVYGKKNWSKKKISFVVFFIIRVYFILSILFLHFLNFLWGFFLTTRCKNARSCFSCSSFVFE